MPFEHFVSYPPLQTDVPISLKLPNKDLLCPEVDECLQDFVSVINTAGASLELMGRGLIEFVDCAEICIGKSFQLNECNRIMILFDQIPYGHDLYADDQLNQLSNHLYKLSEIYTWIDILVEWFAAWTGLETTEDSMSMTGEDETGVNDRETEPNRYSEILFETMLVSRRF